jgi:hypothetical protein
MTIEAPASETPVAGLHASAPEPLPSLGAPETSGDGSSTAPRSRRVVARKAAATMRSHSAMKALGVPVASGG